MMNYLHYRPEITYSQGKQILFVHICEFANVVMFHIGMTDFLAPILSLLDNEILAFSCFAKFMESSEILKDAVLNIECQLVSSVCVLCTLIYGKTTFFG